VRQAWRGDDIVAITDNQARTSDAVDEDFLRQADPYRRELLAHCYRMLGSVHDAEDLVQETYLRAWRAYDRFEGRSSLRTWLHTIANRVCLTALESRGRRPLPTGLGAPSSKPSEDLVSQPEVPWLEPVPDAMVATTAADPATIVTNRQSVRLAMIAALQHLPARQRSVLILREVLNWSAAETAELLGTTTAAVNSMLQRARAQLEQAAPEEDRITEPTEAEQRQLLDRFVTAFEDKNIPAMIELFTKDAVWEMPPFVGWYVGGVDIANLIDTRCPAQGPGDMKLVPTRANGQPAFGLYMRDGDVYRPFNLPVLTIGPAGITHVACFFDLSLFATFGLPETLPVPPGTPATTMPPRAQRSTAGSPTMDSPTAQPPAGG
jgi:RNA polymerase sigma-70 factor (ECF subfamily)